MQIVETWPHRITLAISKFCEQLRDPLLGEALWVDDVGDRIIDGKLAFNHLGWEVGGEEHKDVVRERMASVYIHVSMDAEIGALIRKLELQINFVPDHEAWDLVILLGRTHYSFLEVMAYALLIFCDVLHCDYLLNFFCRLAS